GDRVRQTAHECPGTMKGPDGLLQESLLKEATCDATLATELRATIPGLPFEKMTGVGAKTYADYTSRFGAEPTAFALYAPETTRVAIDGSGVPPPSSKAPRTSRTGATPCGRPSLQPGTSTVATAPGASIATATSTTTRCPASRSSGPTVHPVASSSSRPSSSE